MTLSTSESHSSEKIDDKGTTCTSGAAEHTHKAIREAIAPILNEIQLLHETVHSDYKKLHTDYAELKESITKKSSNVVEN